jgi:hypothetical protein
MWVQGCAVPCLYLLVYLSASALVLPPHPPSPHRPTAQARMPISAIPPAGVSAVVPAARRSLQHACRCSHACPHTHVPVIGPGCQMPCACVSDGSLPCLRARYHSPQALCFTCIAKAPLHWRSLTKFNVTGHNMPVPLFQVRSPGTGAFYTCFYIAA